jgi:hypothetical protein
VEPREGDALRNLVEDEEAAAYLPFEQGREHAYRVDGEIERVACEVDLWGRSVLRSKGRAATLFHMRDTGMFTSLDAVGDAGSVVALLRAALPRVPLEGTESLRWTDTLPARRYRSFALRVLADFAAPFLKDDGFEMDLEMRREGARRVVIGRSRQRDRSGQPIVVTRAELGKGEGPVRVEVTTRGRTRVAERVPGAPGDSP